MRQMKLLLVSGLVALAGACSNAPAPSPKPAPSPQPAPACISDFTQCVALNPSVKCCGTMEKVTDSAMCPVASGVTGGMPERCCHTEATKCLNGTIANADKQCCPGYTLSPAGTDRCPSAGTSMPGAPQSYCKKN